MTRYFITAWCDRVFYAQCEVDAETAEEALAKARQVIHDAPAEECDNGYPWDEWRVDTAETEGVLLHADGNARLRNSADRLLQACQNVVDRWEQGDLAEAVRACQGAIDEAGGRSESETRKPIIIEVRGGVVQDVQNVPPGYEYEIKDYDDIEAEEEAARRPA